jgi:hypothetical protein
VKILGETVASVLGIAVWLALFFVFWGDPDVWDKWHAHAMEQGCNQPTNPE